MRFQRMCWIIAKEEILKKWWERGWKIKKTVRSPCINQNNLKISWDKNKTKRLKKDKSSTKQWWQEKGIHITKLRKWWLSASMDNSKWGTVPPWLDAKRST